MTTKRIHEAGSIRVGSQPGSFRVCLISEGVGSSATFPREFFTQENADALAGSLSFPGHPKDLDLPEHRNPLDAIGSIGDKVTIETDPQTGKIGFYGDYHPSKSKPEVAGYLHEYAEKLGLSIYADADGRTDQASGQWVAESLDGGDPYKSVDLVVAAGRGGKFERVAEGLRKLSQASATAEEEEEKDMEKIDEAIKGLGELKTVVESLVSTLTAKATAEAQGEADAAAVEKAVEARVAKYDEAVTAINEAKLTESQAKELRDAALKGEDITTRLETAKTIVAEARKGFAEKDDDTTRHLGESKKVTEADFSVPSFGKVS